MVSGGGEATIAIVKPRNDDREYKRVLLSNGLQILLVSDPDTDKVSAPCCGLIWYRISKFSS
jgi:secreted Zn-dependent insulinase-like peptidase